ncbi:phosphatidylinositol-specific phospholipase C1-like protein [Dyadobacter sp. LJ53]|uniref:phosphatidylinositol-specific phospholipase C1-like protein n=1 Tax=Dyadobacter chenwenxiniae TaxID=2906456 RepID=UPI001F37A754|nr:phosphatidylinositol-specific phospholipase C1-like protein [Dyadobacter chenwenxiniae]MCF0052461.1 phosphatidylinositol-specific phospholipase C1-like protein [Dyadobacter chenwenxiniae]
MKTIVSLMLALALPVLKSEDTDNLPINKIQVIGSHNSYKEAIDPALFKVFQKKDSVSSSKIDYEHIAITEQLNMGLRNLEIDIYPDEKGGRYAQPKGLDLAPGQKAYDPEGKMKQPGFKILHVPDLDFRSHYFTLNECLEDLKKWSEAHPDHTPVFITLEAKGRVPKAGEAAANESFTEKHFDELDKVLFEKLGKNHIITPDDVRGKYETLESAVLAGNWPLLKNAKGKFLFLLDDKAAKRDMYMAGHPSLKSRAMFACADPGTPEAAMTIRNNPKDPQIKELVKKGYIIRTRADSDTREARINDKSSFDAACNSGAQIITTDYYLKSTHFKSDYSVSFDGKKYFRVSPLFTASDQGGSK